MMPPKMAKPPALKPPTVTATKMPPAVAPGLAPKPKAKPLPALAVPHTGMKHAPGKHEAVKTDRGSFKMRKHKV